MRTIGALLFPGFELLDLYGPLQMLGLPREHLTIATVARSLEPVASRHGPRAAPDRTLADGTAYDVLLVPGGAGTRTEVDSPDLIGWLAEAAARAELTLAVCTGSALLARTGLLDGRRATTNKAAFAWVAEQGPHVLWQREARWVEDGAVITSSGVSAGIDMSLAALARLLDEETARAVARAAEYEWHADPGRDPFARLHGLV